MDAVASVTTTGNAIQNPVRDYYNNSNGEWNSKRGINNFWDVNCTKAGVYDKSTNKSIKTIYDPSPVGYKVPETAAYSSFTPETSYKFYSPTLCNVSSTWDNGWHFYTQPSQKGSTIFIPMLGYYWKNKFIINDGCGYHLAGPSLTNPTNYGCGLGFLENTISSCANSQRALALNIYSVTDD